jgi:hypothetical protein
MVDGGRVYKFDEEGNKIEVKSHVLEDKTFQEQADELRADYLAAKKRERDNLAAMAMQGILAGGGYAGIRDPNVSASTVSELCCDLAIDAYDIADAMIEGGE